MQKNYIYNDFLCNKYYKAHQNNNDSFKSSTKSFVGIADCLLNHILTDKNLSHLEKHFYLLVTSLSNIKYIKEQGRAISLGTRNWASKLNTSQSQIVKLQASLEQKGYLIVERSINRVGQNKRNSIIPTIPDNIFSVLAKSLDRVGASNISTSDKLSYLQMTKMFIKVNYQLLAKICSSNDISLSQKTLFWYIYSASFKQSQKNKQDLYIITSLKELTDKLHCSMSMISKNLGNLVDNKFLNKQHFFVINNNCNRQDKSLWKLSINSCEYQEFNENEYFDLENNTAGAPHVEVGISSRNTPFIENISRIKKDLNRNNISYLGENSKVIFKEKSEKKKEDIIYKVIKKDLSVLSKEKAEKARKFAYSLTSRKLAKGYSSTITKHELAKQLIHHAANWNPIKLGKLNKDNKADTALAVAWKSICQGTWQKPISWHKAEIYNYELETYKQKYQETKKVSSELPELERDIYKTFGIRMNLNSLVTQGKGRQLEKSVNFNLIDDKKLQITPKENLCLRKKYESKENKLNHEENNIKETIGNYKNHVNQVLLEMKRRRDYHELILVNNK